MTDTRKNQIIAILNSIKNAFTPSVDEQKLTMFGLISRYNGMGVNTELIGGDWAAENGFAELNDADVIIAPIPVGADIVG